jgi:hypothetical protein
MCVCVGLRRLRYHLWSKSMEHLWKLGKYPCIDRYSVSAEPIKKSMVTGFRDRNMGNGRTYIKAWIRSVTCSEHV